jgi:hypothetical protein
MNAIDKKFDPRPMPQIAGVQAANGHCIEVTWAAGPRAGVREIVDLSPMINRYKVYAPIRSPEAFAAVSRSDDGEMLEWNDGEIDLPATNVEYLAEQQMTGSDFDAFLRAHNLTRAAAAAEFGKSLRCIQDYVSFDGPLPQSMALACKGFAARELERTMRDGQLSAGWLCSPILLGHQWKMAGEAELVVVYQQDKLRA